MAGRTLLPIIALGALGVTAGSLGLGYGLGQYTISGMDPFYATARSSDWQPEYHASAADRTRTAQQFAAVFDPEPSRY